MKKNILLSGLLLVLTVMGCTKDSALSSTGSGSGGSLARFAISGDYLYIVDESDLKVFNIADPSNPILKNTSPVGFQIETIYPFKDKLFIGSTTVVHIFSVEDPENPEKLSTAVSPDVLRRCDPVVAKDTVAYATLRTNGPCGGFESILAVYNIKDILNPVQVTFLPVTEPYGLGYADSALYVCDKDYLRVYNISNAYAPIPVKTIFDATYIDVIPYNDVLICWVTDGMLPYDISDRMNPSLITKID